MKNGKKQIPFNLVGGGSSPAIICSIAKCGICDILPHKSFHKLYLAFLVIEPRQKNKDNEREKTNL